MISRGKIIFWGLCATLVFLPLAFGSVDEWAIFVFEGATFILFVIHIMGRLTSSRDREGEEGLEKSKTPRWLPVLLVIFLAIAVFQLFPLPPSLLKAVSPGTFNLYQGLSSGGLFELGVGGWQTLSLSPHFSLYELVKYIFYFLFGYLVFTHVREKKQIEIFVLVMILSAVFQSFYGLIEFFGGTQRIFGYEKVHYLGSATGTYINRNHFSGFLEMIFPLSAGYLLAKANFFSMKKGLSVKEKFLWFSQERLQKTIILGLASALIGLGIFFSRSRMGIFVFFITVFLMILALSATGEKRAEGGRRGKRFGKILRIVFLVILFAVILIGARPIIERFSWESLESEVRPVIFKNTVSLIKSYPLFGTGLGTYVYIYTMYEKTYLSGIVDHAHNDYLELLAEAGLIGGGSLILLAFGFGGCLFLRWLKRNNHFVKGVVLGCLMGIVAILLHGLTDFNLHIPANAVYFVTLYALAFRAVHYR